MMTAFFIKFIADYLVVLIALIGAGCLLFDVRSDRYQVYARVGMMGLTALLLAKVTTLVFHPDEVRPFISSNTQPLAAYLNNPGFPSDHVLFVVVITAAVWVATKRRSVSALLLTLSVLVAVGRVVALVHTPLDVTGGAVIASVAVVLWYPRALWTGRNKFE